MNAKVYPHATETPGRRRSTPPPPCSPSRRSQSSCAGWCGTSGERQGQQAAGGERPRLARAHGAKAGRGARWRAWACTAQVAAQGIEQVRRPAGTAGKLWWASVAWHFHKNAGPATLVLNPARSLPHPTPAATSRRASRSVAERPPNGLAAGLVRIARLSQGLAAHMARRHMIKGRRCPNSPPSALNPRRRQGARPPAHQDCSAGPLAGCHLTAEAWARGQRPQGEDRGHLS